MEAFHLVYARRSGFLPSTDGPVLDTSLLVTHVAIFERVLQFLDFHDLSQLLKAGNATLRRTMLDSTRFLASGSFEYDRLGDVSPILPKASISTISAFKHFSALESLDLNCECIRDDFINFLPRNLTRLSVIGEHAMMTDLQLVNLPPRLKTLIIYFGRKDVFVMAAQLQCLPKTLRFLALPMIVVEVRLVPAPGAPRSVEASSSMSSCVESSFSAPCAVEPEKDYIEELDFDFDCLPIDCVCVLQFRLLGGQRQNLVNAIPKRIIRNATLALHQPNPQRGFSMAERDLNI